MAKVLIVEDDELIAEGMADHLRDAGFDASIVGNGRLAVRRLRYDHPDVCVLDLMLPELDGWKLIETIRGEGIGTPILVVSARGSEHDRVHALELGADDYLVKPFSMAELIARIRAVLRRTGDRGAPAAPQPSTSSAIQIGDVSIDPATHVATHAGAPLDLPRREFDLLHMLMAHAGTVLRRTKLMDEVWGADWFGSTKTLDVHIAGLRRRLGDDAQEPRYIHTVRGVGFRFSSPAELAG